VIQLEHPPPARTPRSRERELPLRSDFQDYQALAEYRPREQKSNTPEPKIARPHSPMTVSGRREQLEAVATDPSSSPDNVEACLHDLMLEFPET